MADYGAWGGLGNAISGGIDAYQKAKQMKLQRTRQQQQDDQQAASEGTLALMRAQSIPDPEQRQQAVDFIHTKFPMLFQQKAAPVGMAPTPAPAGIMGGGAIQGPVMGQEVPGDMGAPAPGPSNGPDAAWLAKNGGGLAALAPKADVTAPAPTDVIPAGMSPKDYSAFQKQKMLKETAGAAKAGAAAGMSRGAATYLRTFMTTADSNKLSSVPNATELHNGTLALYDAWQAAQKGDMGTAKKVLENAKTVMSKNSTARQFLNASTPDQIMQAYNNARRMSAIELYKLSTGSQSAPTEEAIAHNSAMYPDITEPPTLAQAKFNQLTESQIMPSISGLKNKLELARDPATGQFNLKELGDIYANLGRMEGRVKGHVKVLPGQNPEGMVPGAPAAAPAKDFSHLW